MTPHQRIAVLASGTGTNARRLARFFAYSDVARVTLCLSNKPSAAVHSLMAAEGIPSLSIPNDVWAERPQEVLDTLRAHQIDFVALCGFLRKVHPLLVKAYEGRMTNIHPSLLPRHGGPGMYGMHVHRAVLAAGDKRSGATVHLVTDTVDGGSILLQGEVVVAPDDTPESLAAKVHDVEMDIYPRALLQLLGNI